MQELLNFCQAFHAAHYLPVTAFRGGERLFSVGFPEVLQEYAIVAPTMLGEVQPPCIGMLPDQALYGMIRVARTGVVLLIGPTYNGGITDTIVRRYIAQRGIPASLFDEVKRFLCVITPFSYNSFSHLLIYLHKLMNGESLTKLTHASISSQQLSEATAERCVESMYQARDFQHSHGTYQYELQMLEYIRKGDSNRLMSLMQKGYSAEMGKPGVLSNDPVRQAKNLFISLVALIGRNAAIPGGMDVEQTYYLMDAYIQECEGLQSVEDVHELTFSVLMDFTQRMQHEQLPQNISGDVFQSIQFINKHLSENISIQDVADHIGRSRSYLSKHFQQEMKQSVGQYITACRMKEAKSLLRHTEKTLSEISMYLCFSSQSHFQNTFKRFYGETPMHYRQRRLQESLLNG